MTGVSPFTDEQKQRVLDEALEGKRPVGDIASEAGMHSVTLRAWLEAHYEAHPDDPRHHLVVRASEKYPRQIVAEAANGAVQLELDTNGASDSGGNEETARDEMPKKKSHGNRESLKIDLKTRAKILKRVARGEETNEAIAREFGIHQSTISYWLRHPREDVPVEADPRKEAFFADARAGMGRTELGKKHGVQSGTVHRWLKALKKLQVKEMRRANMAKVRAAHQEKLKKDPAYREEISARVREGKRRAREPEPPSQTLMSRPEPQPSYPTSSAIVPPSSLVRYPPPSLPTSAAGAFINEAFSECVEERQTLRGMVTLLQREAEQMKRKLEAYRSRYGEI